MNKTDDENDEKPPFSRRQFLKFLAAVGASLGTAGLAACTRAITVQPAQSTPVPTPIVVTKVVEATRLVEKIVEVVRVADTPTPTPAPEENHGMIWYVNIEHEKALADPTRAPNFDSVRRQRTWTLAGEENILMGMVSNKKFVHALMDRILEFNLRIIRNVFRYDVDALMFGDDWGYQRGVVMGPKL